MRAPLLRLLPVSVLIVAGATVLPAVAASAEPTTPWATHVAQPVAVAPVAHQTLVLTGPTPAPPLWLLLLLAPVLVGGAVGVGITLRRLR